MVQNDIEKVKERLLDQPGPADMVVSAISKYNQRAEKTKAWLEGYADQERSRIAGAARRLERRVLAAHDAVRKAPGNVAARQRRDDAVSGRRFMNHVLERYDAGVSLDDILAPVEESGSVGQKHIQELRTRGLVVDVSDRSDVGKAVRGVADYQLLVFDRKFELPAPFSQKLVKSPGMDPGRALDVCIRFLVEKDLKKVFGIDLETLQQENQNPSWRDARIYVQNLFHDVSLKEDAENIVSDLMRFEAVYILPDRKSKQGFIDAKVDPEVVFKEKLDALSPERNYMTLRWMGFDKNHPKVFLTTNNSAGMRFHIYSQLLESMAKNRIPVDRTDLTQLTRSYAHGARGKVLSRSGARSGYDCSLTHVADFPSPPQPDIYAAWPDLAGICHCADLDFMGNLHRGTSYDASYFCKHLVALYCEVREVATRNKRVVLSPFVFPLDDQADFERRVVDHALFMQKRKGGGLKQPNRGEREWLNMVNVSELGYDRTYTTDVPASRQAVRRVYFGK